jgi:calcium/calmodulin-dependent protein kinase I
MELLEGGTLLENIVAKDHYSEKDAAEILKVIITGINGCHELNVVHRDMKPENIMATKKSSDVPDFKITDFGLSVVLPPEGYVTGTLGTREYLAPEMIVHKNYGTSVDMWSIGCIAYTLLCGFHPFSDNETVPLYTQIVTGKWQFFEEGISLSDSAKDFVSQLLTLEPTERMTAKQALLHPFILRSHEVASREPLKGSKIRLRDYIAKQKLRSAREAILAVNRLKRSQLKSLSALRTSADRLAKYTSNWKNSPSPIPRTRINIDQIQTGLKKLREEEKQLIPQLTANEDEITSDKRMAKTMLYIKDCVAVGVEAISTQEKKIEKLLDEYKILKQELKKEKNRNQIRN